MRCRVVAVVGLVLAASLSGCGDSAGRYFGRVDEYSPARPVTMVEARREAVALELELYEYLDKQHGIGNWQAPPIDGGTSQIGHSVFMRCPDGTRSEAWKLARSSVTPNDFPDPEGKWKQITDGVGDLLGPRGFNKPQLQTMPNGDHIALYVNPVSGVRVEISYINATLVVVDTGCAQGKYPGGWPEGTEAIPEHLRTTGRARSDTRQPETWSSIIPQTPVPAPPTPEAPSDNTPDAAGETTSIMLASVPGLLGTTSSASLLETPHGFPRVPDSSKIQNASTSLTSFASGWWST